jgi:hypothetical protein
VGVLARVLVRVLARVYVFFITKKFGYTQNERSENGDRGRCFVKIRRVDLGVLLANGMEWNGIKIFCYYIN